jgi:hypothetical protein
MKNITKRNIKSTKIYAFISYSRKDIEIAEWLHAKLEKYPYPTNLVDEAHRPYHEKLMRRIFIDKTDLHIESRSFSDAIKDALEESKYLILLCSENSTKSAFVDKEVHYFLKTHDNDYSRIVTLFIDKVADSVPPSIENSSIMERHFPIYNSNLPQKSKANLYCFYQIVAYLLGLDFNIVYDRYEKYESRKHRRNNIRIAIFIAMLCGIIALLSYSIYASMQKIGQQKKLLETEQSLTKFEKDVFPAALVFGYQENFLSPVIDYLDSVSPGYVFYIILPKSANSLENQQTRFADFKQKLKEEICVDSLTVVHLDTRMKRGSQLSKICFDNTEIDNVYIDFASTTSAFLKIAKYKKENAAYNDIPIDSIIMDYSNTFISKTRELLGNKADRVKFYTDIDAFINDVKQTIFKNENNNSNTK